MLSPSPGARSLRSFLGQTRNRVGLVVVTLAVVAVPLVSGVFSTTAAGSKRLSRSSNASILARVAVTHNQFQARMEERFLSNPRDRLLREEFLKHHRVAHPVAAFAHHQGSARQRRMISLSRHRAISVILRRDFAIFRSRSASASDAGSGLPGFVQASLAANPFDINVAQAKWIRLPSGQGLWAVPGANGACVVAAPPSYVQGCNGVAETAAGGLLLLSRIKDAHGVSSATITGMVPDGARPPEVGMANGAVEHPSVADNVFSITTAGAPSTLTTGDARGGTHTWKLTS